MIPPRSIPPPSGGVQCVLFADISSVVQSPETTCCISMRCVPICLQLHMPRAALISKDKYLLRALSLIDPYISPAKPSRNPNYVTNTVTPHPKLNTNTNRGHNNRVCAWLTGMQASHYVGAAASSTLFLWIVTSQCGAFSARAKGWGKIPRVTTVFAKDK